MGPQFTKSTNMRYSILFSVNSRVNKYDKCYQSLHFGRQVTAKKMLVQLAGTSTVWPPADFVQVPTIQETNLKMEGIVCEIRMKTFLRNYSAGQKNVIKGCGSRGCNLTPFDHVFLASRVQCQHGPRNGASG